MPSIIAHSYLAYSVRKKLNHHSFLHRCLMENVESYFLGAQGPDPFFYYNLMPWESADYIPKLADLIHMSKTSEFLVCALDSLQKYDLSSPKAQKIIAYWMGFLTHFALDTTAHPYVYYFSGINKSESDKETGAFYNHQKFETTIDTYLKNHIIDPQFPRLQKDCMPDKPKQLYCICQNMSHVFNSVYRSESPVHLDANTFFKCITGMKRTVSLLNDPLYTKRVIGKCIEDKIDKPNYIMSVIFPQKLETQHDYMNFAHSAWTHPCDSDIVSNDSFLDIFEKAIDTGFSLIELAWANYKNGYSNDSLHTLIDDRSYDTGIHWNDLRKLTFSQSIYKTTASK